MHYEQKIDYYTQRGLKKTAEITAGKATPRPAVRIPQGMRGQDIGDLRLSNAQRTNIGISTGRVRELHEEGRKPGDIAKLLRTTPQTISYHLKKIKI